MQRILSIDGGGIRGVVPCIWLSHVERTLAHLGDFPLCSVFDLLAGNSTGAIIVAGLAAGKAPTEMAELYEHASRAIFPQSPSRMLSRARRVATQGLSAPKFDGRGLDRVLQLVFADRTLGELDRRVMFTAYDTITRAPVIFRNDLPEHRDLPVWEVCRASSAAPGYFPAHCMTVDGREMALIDGGVYANNPVLCAIDVALARLDADPDPRRLRVLSLGTGRGPYPISAREARHWGAAQWAAPVLDVVFNAASDINDQIAERLVGPGYLRLQIDLPPGRQLLDDASPEQLAELKQRAMDRLLMPDAGPALHALIHQLVAPRSHNEQDGQPGRH